MYRKEIQYDRETRDYAMYLDGLLVGFARTHHEAEVTLNQTVFEMMNHGNFAPATELDGGQPEAYTLAAEAGAFGPQTPTWDINNSEYCPAHNVWFGRMPCPDCYTEKRQHPVCATCGNDGDCPDCAPPESLRQDCLNVITMALGQTNGAASVVGELRRVKARLEAVELV